MKKNWKIIAFVFIYISLLFLLLFILMIRVSIATNKEMLEHACNADCIGELYQYSKIDDDGRCICVYPVEEFGEIGRYVCLRDPSADVPLMIEIDGRGNIYNVSDEKDIFSDDIILNPAFVN